MDRTKILELLQPYTNYSSTGFGGSTTIVDQYRNADRLLQGLNDIKDLNHDSQEYQDFANQFKSEKTNAILNGALVGLNGLTTIGANAVRDAQINDTTDYENQIGLVRNFGNYNYGTYGQLENDIANRQQLAPLSYQDIRGVNTGQQIGSVLSSGLTGAVTGSQIGGPVGAAVGFGLGVVGGVGGVLAHNANARNQYGYLQSSAVQANAVSQMNTQAAHERIGENEYRNKMVRAVADGGQIRRQSIKDYASKVLSSSVKDYRGNHNDLIRTYENGGVRIKVRKR